MKKVLLIVCVATMLVGMVVASASASTTNWVVMIKASNVDYNNGGSATTVGVYNTALTPSAASWPTTSGAAATAVDASGSYYSKQILAAAGGDKTWGLKVGARSEYPISTVRLSLWNTALDAASRDTLLDTSNIYTLYHGQDLVAWFSNSAKADDTRYASNLWFDVSSLLQAKGWNPTAAATGWYKDMTVVKAAGFAGIDSYSFSSITTYNAPTPTETPEPGSLLALGSGLIGLVGFTARRRKA
jgi:hypothetical protein